MYSKAVFMLKKIVGENAEFRKGQFEAISHIVNERTPLLLVQRTGWGKSIVYFIAARLLREQGAGPALLVSPLLSLMRNQVDSVQKAGIVRCERLDSSNQSEWNSIVEKLDEDMIDILLVSPERLGNEKFRDKILPSFRGGIGLFIIDEAHCISDWGHDFRPDYRRIVRILNTLPGNIPILGTTATANDRVIDDIREQLGEDIQVSRGNLTRDSLYLQNIVLDDRVERLALLAQIIPKLDGSGIIYCLTKKDTSRVAAWLRENNIHALEYHADLKDGREELENALIQNKVKVLVATVALGMGFDKPDLSFVIHYQKPKSVIAYYQQVGRGGRALSKAYGLLMGGSEDDNINEFFINTAFPKVDHLKQIIHVIENSDEGLTMGQIQKSVNATYGQINKALKQLLIDGIISEEKRIYSRTLLPWKPDFERMDRVTELRKHELKRMNDFMRYGNCLMEFVCNELDDPNAKACGRCSNCAGSFFPDKPSDEYIKRAIEFLKGDYYTIKARKIWPAGIMDPFKQKYIAEEHRINDGCSLCYYGDAGWGLKVARCKYDLKKYSDELVDASADLIINNWNPEPFPDWVTAIPSLRTGNLVRDFAERLAIRLNLPFRMVISSKKETQLQKRMQNSFQQCSNIIDAFEISDNCPPGAVLLVDDITDSGWTLTVAGKILREAGCETVLPYTLAAAPTKDNS